MIDIKAGACCSNYERWKKQQNTSKSKEMWVIVLEDSDKPTRKVEVRGPFKTETAAQDELFDIFHSDVVHIMGHVVEVKET